MTTTWKRQVHFSFGFFDDTMPESIRKSITNVQNENPGWTVKIWGPEKSRALIQKMDPDFIPIYDGYANPIQRSDASRYYILESEGGLYMDIDYRLNVSLDEIIEHLHRINPASTLFLNGTPNGVSTGHVSNSFMYAGIPNHPFWQTTRQVLRQEKSTWIMVRYFYILHSTGPEMLTKALKTYTGPAPVTIMPVDQFNPCGLCSKPYQCSEGKRVLAFHANSGSWALSSSDNVIRSVYCNPTPWITGLALFILVCVFIPLFLKCRYSTTCKPCQR